MFMLCYFTSILNVTFFLLPSFAVAVIVAFPFFFAFTFPFPFTVATFLLEDFHVTFWLSAVAGNTVSVNVWLVFAFIFFVPLIFNFFTLTAAFPHLNFTDALLPSAVTAVIVTVPAFLIFTFPVAVTVAVLELDVDQVTFAFFASASSGVTTAFREYDFFTFAFNVP